MLCRCWRGSVNQMCLLRSAQSWRGSVPRLSQRSIAQPILLHCLYFDKAREYLPWNVTPVQQPAKEGLCCVH